MDARLARRSVARQMEAVARELADVRDSQAKRDAFDRIEDHYIAMMARLHHAPPIEPYTPIPEIEQAGRQMGKELLVFQQAVEREIAAFRSRS